MAQTEGKARLTREAWLAKALDILAENPEHLRIDELAAQLGVSKGSFYWHFQNRADFVRALAGYWRNENTQAVADAIADVDGPAEERLRVLMQFLLDNRLARYDLAVRAWARHEPDISSIIREVDEIRLNTVSGIFRDMGLGDTDALMRARVFVVCHSLDDAISVALSPEEAEKQLEARHAFFTRR